MVSVTVNFDSLSIPSGSLASASKDVSSLIPVGYKCVDVCMRSSGSQWLYVTGVYLNKNTLNLTMYVRNTSSNTDSGAPQATLFCVRDV